MTTISGKRAFLEILKSEGVDTIFGNPGTTELPLMDALAVETGIRYVLGLQEAAVVAIADGYAQASGRLTVVNTHVTPGLGNALGMLYDAQKAASPILITAGQHDQSFSFTEPILWGDLPVVARPFVKWSSEVPRIEELPRAVRRAAKTAMALPTGPVFLSLPGNILQEEAELDLLQPTRIAPRIRPDRQAVEEAARLLARSDHPVLIAGDAVAQSGAFAEMVQLAELLGAPVYTESVPSRATFPATHPLFAGPIGRLAPLLNATLKEHDLMFSVGGDLFTLSLPSDVDPMPAGLPLIHLDNDPWEIGKNYPAKVALFGDARETLREVIQLLIDDMPAARKSKAKQRLAETRAAIADKLAKLKAKAKKLEGTQPMQPLALLHAIGEALPPEAVVIDETLSSGTGLRQFLKSDDPQSFYGLRGGGIGWGLPASIGIKLALPSRPVVALVGDGSAMYTIQALWTAANSKVPIIAVILNNSSYRILKQRAHNLRGYAAQTGSFVGMNLVDPPIDYVGLARAMGVEGLKAASIADVVTAITRGLKSATPLLIEAKLDSALWDA